MLQHHIAKWYISRALDGGQALPAWVERRLNRDPALQRFYHQSLQLDDRLRTGESAGYARDMQAARQPLLVEPDYRRRSSKRAKLSFASAAIGLAACLVWVVATLQFDRLGVDSRLTADNTKEVPGSDVADVRPIVASELAIQMNADVDRTGLSPSNELATKVKLQQLRALIDAGQQFSRNVNVRANKLATNIAKLEQMNACLDLEVSQAIQPARELGTLYGEMLDGIDVQVEAENRKLISEGMAAWQYFAHKIPRTAVALAGW